MKLTGKKLVVVASGLFALCLIPIGWAAYSAVVFLTTDCAIRSPETVGLRIEASRRKSGARESRF